MLLLFCRASHDESYRVTVQIRKYKNAMCEYPEIKLVRENEDGSCQFIMPKKWFAPRLPAKLTPEQRAAYVERGKKLAKLLHGT